MINHMKTKYNLLQILIFFIFIFIFYISYFYSKITNISLFFEIVIVLILIYLDYKETNCFASPLIFWYLFWLTAISIARIYIKVYEMNFYWSKELLDLITINTVLFFVFYKLFYYLYKKFKLSNRKKIKINIKSSMYTIISIILWIGNIAFIMNCITTRSIPQLSNNVDVLRRPFVETSWFSVLNCTRFVYALIPIYFSLTKNSVHRRRIIYYSLINFFFTFLSGWRAYLFQIIIFFTTSQFYIFTKNGTISRVRARINKRKQRRFILIIGLLSFFLIVIIAVTRGGTLEPSEYLNYALSQIYLYIAPNFLNMQSALISLVPNKNFLYTTEAFWGIFFNSSDLKSYVPLSFSIGAFNVSTYLLHPFADYGLFGTCLWTVLIAILSSTYFVKSNRTINISNLVVVGIMNITIFNLHNGFFLRSSSIIIWIFLSYIISKMNLKEVGD